MRRIFIAFVIVTACVAAVAAQKHTHSTALFIPFSEVKWEKMEPELGDRSAEIAFLRIDPITKATQLLIRVPPDTYVPKHWHSANETHTISSGTFIMQDGKKRIELPTGSFNFMPKKMVHEAWTKATEGALLFITLDGAWDIHWVEDEAAKKASTKPKPTRPHKK